MVVQSWMGGSNNRELRDAVGIVFQQAVYVMNAHCANGTSCTYLVAIGVKLSSLEF